MPHKPLKKIYLDLLVIVAGFCLLAYLFRLPYLLIPAGMAALSAVHPKTAGAVSWAWEKLGKALGWVNSRILLSVFFVLFITPFAILVRWTSKKRAGGEWKDVSDQKTDFSKPW